MNWLVSTYLELRISYDYDTGINEGIGEGVDYLALISK